MYPFCPATMNAHPWTRPGPAHHVIGHINTLLADRPLNWEELPFIICNPFLCYTRHLCNPFCDICQICNHFSAMYAMFAILLCYVPYLPSLLCYINMPSLQHILCYIRDRCNYFWFMCAINHMRSFLCYICHICNPFCLLFAIFAVSFVLYMPYCNTFLCYICHICNLFRVCLYCCTMFFVARRALGVGWLFVSRISGAYSFSLLV